MSHSRVLDGFFLNVVSHLERKIYSTIITQRGINEVQMKGNKHNADPWGKSHKQALYPVYVPENQAHAQPIYKIHTHLCAKHVGLG